MSEVLTGAETKEALECCTKFHRDCLKCPSYIGKGRVGCEDRVKKGAFYLINRYEARITELEGKVVIQQGLIDRQQAEIKGLTKEKDKAWELFKKKTDEDIELQGLCDKRRIENEKLHVGTVEKTRALFQAVVSKFMSIKDLYVIVDGEYLPWEPSEEVEHLFGMSISGDNDEIDKETDRVIKELVGEDNG